MLNIIQLSSNINFSFLSFEVNFDWLSINKRLLFYSNRLGLRIVGIFLLIINKKYKELKVEEFFARRIGPQLFEVKMKWTISEWKKTFYCLNHDPSWVFEPKELKWWHIGFILQTECDIWTALCKKVIKSIHNKQADRFIRLVLNLLCLDLNNVLL